LDFILLNFIFTYLNFIQFFLFNYFVFFIILYNFILIILYNFIFKNIFWILWTVLPMASICWYFPESWKTFTAYATIIDELIPSVIYRWKYRRTKSICIFQRVEKHLLLIPQSPTDICRQNNSVGIFPTSIFFAHIFYL